MVTTPRGRWAAALSAAGLVLGGCASTPHTAAADLDAFHESNVSFFEPVSYGGAALEAEHYGTVDDAVRHASAVVITEVTDVRVGTVLHDEAPSDDVVRNIAIDIHPVKVIKGHLDDGTPDTLTPERLAGPDMDASIKSMRSHLPGLSVWFLRDRSQYSEQMKGEPMKTTPGRAYRLICSQGLFVQGRDSVTNPLVGTDYGMVDQARKSYARLSALVDHIRSVDGWTGRAPELDGGGPPLLPPDVDIDHLDVACLALGCWTTPVFDCPATPAWPGRPAPRMPTHLTRDPTKVAMCNVMNQAVTLSDLRAPPSNHLEKLKADRDGQHSIKINEQ